MSKPVMRVPVFCAVLLFASLQSASVDAAANIHSKAHQVQRGIASVYSGRLEGRKTASGERFDDDALTAAHRTLPIGSRVRVTNARSHRSVTVRINDRGPAPRNRLIDLSPAAARAIGLRDRKGVAPVRVDVLQVPDGAN